MLINIALQSALRNSNATWNHRGNASLCEKKILKFDEFMAAVARMGCVKETHLIEDHGSMPPLRIVPMRTLKQVDPVNKISIEGN